ncbi:MAG: hypothetical protein COA45_05565 [Zetaproteobacteria bacterium]|nr:MAG: hypothetical protein COA45_05565 [Zetaproteobacteria bacterium]
MRNKAAGFDLSIEKQHVSGIVEDLKNFLGNIEKRDFDARHVEIRVRELLDFVTLYYDVLHGQGKIDLKISRKTHNKLSEKLVHLKLCLFSGVSSGLPSDVTSEIEAYSSAQVRTSSEREGLFEALGDLSRNGAMDCRKYDDLFDELEAIIYTQVAYVSRVYANHMVNIFSDICNAVVEGISDLSKVTEDVARAFVSQNSKTSELQAGVSLSDSSNGARGVRDFRLAFGRLDGTIRGMTVTFARV